MTITQHNSLSLLVKKIPHSLRSDKSLQAELQLGFFVTICCRYSGLTFFHFLTDLSLFKMLLNFCNNIRFFSFKFNSSTGDDGKPQPDNFLFRTTGKSADVEHCVGLFNNRNKDGVKLHDQVLLVRTF